MKKKETKNSKLLWSFMKYCKIHPEERFWQALRNWSGWIYIRASMNNEKGEDTFYWNDN